jgi:ornithine cyclodeaminase/alanine dehydrogenase-like protein (mu-crystallin family)
MAFSTKVLVLDRADVERLLDLGELMEALAEGFRALTRGDVVAPDRNQLAMPDGDFLLSMPGRVGDGLMAVKVVTLFESNPASGVPAHLATIGLYDPATGACRAFVDGTYITAIRTSAAAALACDLLARPDARVLAIVGSGVQAEHHLQTFPLVRDLAEIRIAARRHDEARRVAEGDPRARAVGSIEEAVRGADVVAMVTSAEQPVIDPAWLSPGAHVSSVGYKPPHGELPRELARTGHLFVETRRAFQPPPVGCCELQGADPAAGTELGEVLLGRAPGRRDAQEITVYKAMGHIVEDIAAAELVLEAARRAGAGTPVVL